MHLNGRTVVHAIPQHLHCSCTQMPHLCRRSSQGRQRPPSAGGNDVRCTKTKQFALAWHFLSFSCHPALQLAQWLSTWRRLF